ncbi:hypothetical protein GYMLUDRAFT_242635 [Collybiopsis luxurians FD-317 M1]|uniref:Uncharacterized protein n=1 Tax=Collybiopsis luxurians FD-317 M1 TaxID=944289 RepID=A0A0D0C2Y1_9AGAR|nr:hypothetical protein GYMLUDRAFT_242635 [Collybiopsis luxurians FD-317 M1]
MYPNLKSELEDLIFQTPPKTRQKSPLALEGLRPNRYCVAPQGSPFGSLESVNSFHSQRVTVDKQSGRPESARFQSPRTVKGEEGGSQPFFSPGTPTKSGNKVKKEFKDEEPSFSPCPGSSGSSTHRPCGVKIEEVDDEEGFLSNKRNPYPANSPTPTHSRPVSRKSEPTSSLTDQVHSLNLDTSTPKRTKPRHSEPPKPPTSPDSQSPSPSKNVPSSNNTKLDENVFRMLNTHHDWKYGENETSLGYANLVLKPHQVHGRRWMAERESDGKPGGIIADEMGQTLAMLVRIKDSLIEARAAGTSVNPTLIVGPLSILHQWEEEARRLHLTCIVYHGVKRYSPEKLEKADLVITTYGILSSNYGASNYEDTEVKNHRPAGVYQVNWFRVVLDEAHEIRNPGTKKAKASFKIAERTPFKWCLTGTPLHNKLLDLYPLFRFLGIANFSSLTWFQSNIERPHKRYDGLEARKLLQASIIDGALAEIMLRRLKTDIVNGRPILELPRLIIKTRDIDLSARERNFYKLLESRMQHALENLLKEIGAGNIQFYSAAWVLLLRLRQACLHPNLLVSQILSDAAEDAEIEEKTFALQDECLQEQQLIVFTLASIRMSDDHLRACSDYIDMAKSFRKDEASTKISVMLDILREIRARPGNEKTIVFSQFTSMLNLIEPFLTRNRMRFVRLDGKMGLQSRKDTLNELRSDASVTIILVSLKAGGVGLNLTECNNVILFDLWWNPAVEEQAFARAHRMGQSRTVEVHKLVTVETVERRILQLQDEKKRLAAETLDRNQLVNMQGLSTKHLLRLMDYGSRHK